MSNDNILMTIRRELRNSRDLRTLKEILRDRYGMYLKKDRLKVIKGELYYSGTFGEVTIYWRDGECKIRSKTSLNKERISEEACFENSRKSSSRFADGNKLASKVYAMAGKKDYQLFCLLKKMAIGLIKEGKSLSEVEKLLVDYSISKS